MLRCDEVTVLVLVGFDSIAFCIGGSVCRTEFVCVYVQKERTRADNDVLDRISETSSLQQRKIYICKKWNSLNRKQTILHEIWHLLIIIPPSSLFLRRRCWPRVEWGQNVREIWDENHSNQIKWISEVAHILEVACVLSVHLNRAKNSQRKNIAWINRRHSFTINSGFSILCVCGGKRAHVSRSVGALCAIESPPFHRRKKNK